jgi:hypothetical protein
MRRGLRTSSPDCHEAGCVVGVLVAREEGELGGCEDPSGESVQPPSLDEGRDSRAVEEIDSIAHDGHVRETMLGSSRREREIKSKGRRAR